MACRRAWVREVILDDPMILGVPEQPAGDWWDLEQQGGGLGLVLTPTALPGSEGMQGPGQPVFSIGIWPFLWTLLVSSVSCVQQDVRLGLMNRRPPQVGQDCTPTFILLMKNQRTTLLPSSCNGLSVPWPAAHLS